MLLKKLKCYDTSKVVLSTIYNFSNFDINTEEVKLSRVKQFFNYVTRV